jgi:hypothetical protein
VVATIATAITISTRVKPPSRTPLLSLTPKAVPRAAAGDSGQAAGRRPFLPPRRFSSRPIPRFPRSRRAEP